MKQRRIMVGRKKKLAPLIGLVVYVPVVVGFAPSGCPRSGQQQASPTVVQASPSPNDVHHQSSRRAFLMSTCLVAGTSFVQPSNAATSPFNLDLIFKRGRKTTSGDGGQRSGLSSDSSDSSASTSDCGSSDSSSMSNKETRKEKRKKGCLNVPPAVNEEEGMAIL